MGASYQRELSITINRKKAIDYLSVRRLALGKRCPKTQVSQFSD
jgi:hypothetical protein